MQEQAAVTRALKKENGLRLYKQDWKDLSHWQQLASMYSIRLPSMTAAPSWSKLRNTARKLGMVDGTWEEGFFGIGYGSIKKAVENTNKKLQEGKQYGLLAYIGWLLEERHERGRYELCEHHKKDNNGRRNNEY
jgi:hypothetical protein